MTFSETSYTIEIKPAPETSDRNTGPFEPVECSFEFFCHQDISRHACMAELVTELKTNFIKFYKFLL